MSEKHQQRHIIIPDVAGTLQPLLSVMIKSYEFANYLRETRASVLAPYSRLEIADDYSSKDDPEAVNREIAGDRAVYPFIKTYHDFK